MSDRLADDSAWDPKRYRFLICITDHDGPERLMRLPRERNNGGGRSKFCEEHFSWTCLTMREVSGAEARAFARGTVAAQGSNQ